jgi:hypothetical protein
MLFKVTKRLSGRDESAAAVAGARALIDPRTSVKTRDLVLSEPTPPSSRTRSSR